MKNSTPPETTLRFYGRRKGKKMRGTRLDALDTVFPKIKIDLPQESPDSLSRPAGEGRGEGERWTRHRATASAKARNLRKDPTEAEKAFWQKVRDRQINGFKFKRQFPIGPYVADFACPEAMLVVEIDGGQHNENPQDEKRTVFLEKVGYEVLRFWNNDILGNMDGALGTLTLTLSRRAGEGTRHHPAASGTIVPAEMFPFTPAAVHLEIGFGDGKHLLHQAINAPDTGFIGCEPFMNGVATLCTGIKEHNLNNIRIFADDARLLMARLKAQSIDRCYILNSDPWPKTRHHKRRFIQTETLDTLHRLLKPGAELRLTSDHPGLAEWQLGKTFFHPGFNWTAERAADWKERPQDMPETRYQQKNMAGHPVTFLSFARNP